MEILKYREADNGNCRVYYTAAKRLYCWQLDDARNNVFKLYVCSKDGEPSHEVSADAFASTEPPKDEEAIERELAAFLAANT
jgi:hypothetical protein